MKRMLHSMLDNTSLAKITQYIMTETEHGIEDCVTVVHAHTNIQLSVILCDSHLCYIATLLHAQADAM